MGLIESYLVGGAVRDHLLGLKQQDKDWVVVGSTPEQLSALGFKAIGRDFPVFLHPSTKEEYALARTERKVSKGYQGFTFFYDPTVTLEQDLSRRDLTINAMAMAKTGDIIDPFNGQRDLQLRQLRHVSAAFTEDPLRVLRVCRFLARFASLGFTVAPETRKLIKQIALSNELQALSGERVWAELSKTLSEKTPQAGFTLLRKTSSFTALFPELVANTLYDKQLFLKNYKRTFVSLNSSDIKEADRKPLIRTGYLFYTLKTVASIERCLKLLKRLRAPKAYQALVRMIILYTDTFIQIHSTIQKPPHSLADNLLSLMESMDAIRRPERFTNFIESLNGLFPEHALYTTDYVGWLDKLKTASKQIDRDQLQGLKGKQIAQAIRIKRLSVLQTLISQATL